MYKMPDINSIRNNRVDMGLVTIGSNALDVTTGIMYRDPDLGLCIESPGLCGKATITQTDIFGKKFKFRISNGKEYTGVLS